MGEVKRKRPWENEEIQEDNDALRRFLHQIILCTLISIGILIAIQINPNNYWKQWMSRELTKDIQVQQVYSFVDHMKKTIAYYIE